MAIRDTDRERHEESLNRLQRMRFQRKFATVISLISLSFGSLLLLYKLFLGGPPAEKRTANKDDVIFNQALKRIDSLSKRDSLLNLRVSILNLDISKPLHIRNDTNKYFALKLSDLENKFQRDSSQIYEIRASINPDKPEEVLRLARLNDKIEQLKQDNLLLRENLKSEQLQFATSVNNQLTNARTFYIALITILLPIAIKFGFQAVKDFNKE
jgi:hypothetical protein